VQNENDVDGYIKSTKLFCFRKQLKLKALGWLKMIMIYIRYSKFKTLIMSILLSYSLFDCASANYYTGETLEDGESVVILGLEYINPADQEEVGNLPVPCTVSLGYAQGFPDKFELGLGIIIPLFIEGRIRYEFTPKDNRFINMSFNAHFVKALIEAPYFQYGITASRAIGPVTPFLSYYQYSGFGIPEDWDFQSLNMQTISFGMTIPVEGQYLVPEINYQFTDDDISNGWPVYGIGLRLGKK